MFWVLSNCSDVLTQIEESEVCHLTDWIELKGVCCCQHCFAVKFFWDLPWMEKLRVPVFQYTYFYDINMDMNFSGRQMLLLNSLYFLCSHFY